MILSKQQFWELSSPTWQHIPPSFNLTGADCQVSKAPGLWQVHITESEDPNTTGCSNTLHRVKSTNCSYRKEVPSLSWHLLYPCKDETITTSHFVCVPPNSIPTLQVFSFMYFLITLNVQFLTQRVWSVITMSCRCLPWFCIKNM